MRKQKQKIKLTELTAVIMLYIAIPVLMNPSSGSLYLLTCPFFYFPASGNHISNLFFCESGFFNTYIYICIYICVCAYIYFCVCVYIYVYISNK